MTFCHGLASYDEDDSGFAICTVCGEGKHAPSINSNICADCVEGKHTKPGDSTNCHDCPTGKYSDAGAISSESCVYCPAGHFKKGTEPYNVGEPTSMLRNCKICSSGKYSIGIDDTGACTACPSGRYLSAGGTNAAEHNSLGKCTACQEGKYGR